MGNKRRLFFSFVLIRVDSWASVFHGRDGRDPFFALKVASGVLHFPLHWARAHRHAPSRGGWKKSGHGPLETLHVGRGAHPTAAGATALPETGRSRATFQKSKRKRTLVFWIAGRPGRKSSRKPINLNPAVG